MDKFDQAGVSGRIKAIMRGLGLNQAGLAAELGITQPAVSKYLHDRMPPVEVCYRLAQLGGVTIEWLLTGKDSGAKLQVADPETGYFTGMLPQDRISRLPGHVQEALRVIIDRLADEGR